MTFSYESCCLLQKQWGDLVLRVSWTEEGFEERNVTGASFSECFKRSPGLMSGAVKYSRIAPSKTKLIRSPRKIYQWVNMSACSSCIIGWCCSYLGKLNFIYFYCSVPCVYPITKLSLKSFFCFFVLVILFIGICLHCYIPSRGQKVVRWLLNIK